MMRRSEIYNWVAETARLLPTAIFREPHISYRDGKTRIVVTDNENEETFVISSSFNGGAQDTPTDVHEHFHNLLLDNCEVCYGKSGGTRGNENVIDGVVTCDYCHVAGRAR